MPDDLSKSLSQLGGLLKLLAPPAAAPPAPVAGKGYVEPLPAFPRDVLPPDVRRYVTAAANTARVPVEMVAVPFLAFAGSVIGNQARLDVNSATGHGWIERPVLWIAMVAITGAGKSPAIAAARLPLDRLQEEIWTGFRAGSSRDGLRLVSPTDPDLPARPDRLLTTDPTMEALVEELQTSPGIAIVRDELIGVIRAMNQNRSHRGDDRQKYLSLWSHQPLAPTRRNASGTFGGFVRAPVVSIVGGIQPRVLPGLRSKQEDGFIERFLPLVIGLPVRYWSEAGARDTPPPDVDGMVDLFRALRSLAKTVTDPDGLLVLRHPDARALWATWYNENVDRTEAVPLPVKGFYLKLPAHVARIALILHLLWHPDDPDQPLSGQTMAHAVALGEFFRTHIHRMIPFLGEPGRIPQPKPLLTWRILRLFAEAEDPSAWVTRHDLYNRLGRPPREELTKALDELISHERLESRTIDTPNGRRPTRQYRSL